jgi:formate hydrogenlyase subunit 4
MSALLGFLALALHAVLVLAAAPTLAGLADRWHARLAGRTGPDLLQPWRDLLRLSRKQMVLPESASPFFAMAPLGVLALTATAALLVPSFATGTLAGPLSDLLVIAGLLAASRALLVLAGLDAGTALAATGPIRAATLGTLAEPVLFLVILVVAGSAGTSNLDLAAAALRDAPSTVRAPLLLAVPALAVAGFALGARTGGAEAAMLGEGALLEYSGRHLAALSLAAWLRRVVWLDLVAAIACPFGLAGIEWGIAAWLAAIALWAVKLLVLTGLLTLAEGTASAAGPGQRPAWLGLAFVVALVAAALLFLGSGSV